MANFENGFYEAHAVKVDEQKLSEKFHVAYTPEGSTPDGYHVYESLTIETGKGAIDISRDGSAVYMSGGNETERSMTEAYNMIGIDTDSKEFKQFQKDIQKPENYNAQTVEKMLETVPQLTAEKQVEILNTFSYENEREQAEFKHNFVNSEIVKNLAVEAEAKGFTKEQIHELAEETWDKQVGLSDNELEQVFVEKTNEQLVEKGYEPIDYQSLKDKENSLSQDKNFIGAEYLDLVADKGITAERLREISYDSVENFVTIPDSSYKNRHLHEEIVSEINRELVEKGHNKIELAEPGRQYTGEITSIDEERTTQVTKSGVTIIHETQNLPGIQEKEVGKSVKIDYANGKEATIEDKSSGLERGKEAKLEHDHQAERSHDSGDRDHDIPF